MSTQIINSFHVIGIETRTVNKEGKSAKDISELWNKFLTENIMEKIPNKLSVDVYCVYTDYEGDYTQPYTAVLGCKVTHLDQVPNGYKGIKIPKGEFKKFKAEGNLREGVVEEVWSGIWDLDLNRAYNADFEIYGTNIQSPEQAEVDIFVELKS